MMTTPSIIQGPTKGEAICPYCGVGCRLLMESAHGELIRVTGVADAPANLGGICAKGATLPEVIHTPTASCSPTCARPAARNSGR
jgi:anaerobic selenocysteine-containing dehydrogenase